LLITERYWRSPHHFVAKQERRNGDDEYKAVMIIVQNNNNNNIYTQTVQYTRISFANIYTRKFVNIYCKALSASLSPFTTQNE